MDVRLRLPDDPDGVELKQLYDWLIRDHELHPVADISLRAGSAREPDDVTMGDAFDIVQLVLDSGFQLASLGAALLAWRRAQRPRSVIVVEYRGVRVELPADTSPETVDAFLDTLRGMDGTGAGRTEGEDGHPDAGEPEDDITWS
ncbi:effector-associated constant component EACC1 [Streptomyces sp. 7R007]